VLENYASSSQGLKGKSGDILCIRAPEELSQALWVSSELGVLESAFNREIPNRIALSAEGIKAKMKAIYSHRTQLNLRDGFLLSFIRSEEIVLDLTGEKNWNKWFKWFFEDWWQRSLKRKTPRRKVPGRSEILF